MYKTPDGIRMLEGPERRLIVGSLAMIVDMLADDDFLTGISIFDDLTRNQRIAAYHSAARALLTADEPAPALTAVLEAAVASIYHHAQGMIEMEISDDLADDEDYLLYPETPTWRELAIAAGRQMGIEDLHDPAVVDWDLLLVCLEDHVLWDHDWAMVAHLDAAPDLAHRIKDELGIAEDYYFAMPDDPRDADAERLLTELRTLTGDARWTS